MKSTGLLVEPFAVQETYCDGVEHVVVDGIMTATAFRLTPPSHYHGEPQRVVVGRWVLKVESAMNSMADAQNAIRTPFVPSEADRLGRH